jgi:hypothetical protein
VTAAEIYRHLYNYFINIAHSWLIKQKIFVKRAVASFKLGSLEAVRDANPHRPMHAPSDTKKRTQRMSRTVVTLKN